jgi:hypothetical protein
MQSDRPVAWVGRGVGIFGQMLGLTYLIKILCLELKEPNDVQFTRISFRLEFMSYSV